MKIFIVTLTDSTEPNFIDVRAFRSLARVILHVRNRGHGDTEILCLRRTGEINWRSMGSNEDENMRLVLTTAELYED